MEIRGMPARDILRYISSGEVSAAEVVETYLDAIREIGPQTNAFIEVLEPAARADASRIDKECGMAALRGSWRGCLWRSRTIFA